MEEGDWAGVLDFFAEQADCIRRRDAQAPIEIPMTMGK